MGIVDSLTELPTWAILLALVLVLCVIHHNVVFGKFRRLGIYHPQPWPFVGNAMFAWKHGFFEAARMGYNDLKRKKMYGLYEGRNAILNLADLDLIKEITVKQSNTFTDRKQYAVINQKGLDSIMFNTNGAAWKDQRNMLKPSLSSARLRSVISARVEKIAGTMLDVMKEKAAKNTKNEFELYEIIGCFAMDVIGDIAFDVQCDSLHNPQHTFVTTSRKILDVFGVRLFAFEFFAPPFTKQILDFLGIMILPKKDIYFLRDYVTKALKNRRSQTQKKNQDDFLQYMVDRSGKSSEDRENKRPFSDEEILSASLTFILAGYDTTAKSLAMAMYMLAMNPHCYKKAQKEVDEVLKGEFPTKDTAESLQYLNCCLNETHRLYPLGFVTERRCGQDTTLGGQFIPKDMIVRIPVVGIHRDPDIYPNPDVYDPERFQPENVAKRHPMSFLPFGSGPRACFGQPLANLMMRIAISCILQVYDLEPSDRSVYPIVIDPTSDMIPKDPMWLKLTPRKKT